MGISLPPASYFQQIIDDYVNSDEGRAALGLPKAYTRQELMEIGRQLEHDIHAAFVGVLRTGSSEGDQYGNKITVGISKKDGTRSVTIHYSSGFLYRPSLEKARRETGVNFYETKIHGKRKLVSQSFGYWAGTGSFTGGGIEDIYKHITQGYSAAKPAWGLWRGEYTHALMHRTGTPFVPAVIAKYEAMYPGVRISYPGEWG